MSITEYPPCHSRHVVFLAIVSFLVLAGIGCGGSGSAGGPPSPTPTPTPFQARPFPQDYFIRLPNQNGAGSVPSEVYDSALKEVFVSNPNMNAVEVYSTADGHHVPILRFTGPVAKVGDMTAPKAHSCTCNWTATASKAGYQYLTLTLP